MKNGRALTFILLMSMIMMSAVLLQSVFAPKPGADENAEKANQDPAVAALQADDPKQDGGTPDPKSSDTSSAETSVSENKTDSEKTDSDNANSEIEKPAESDRPPRVAQDEFISIGSLNPDGSDRFLVTANKRGGTIRRIELNFRKPNGRYKYRDIVWKGGYLGCLDCSDVDGSCQVRVVGTGTPADIAGIQVGDTIVSVDEIPILSADDFEDYLEHKTEPGDTLEIVTRRDGQTQTRTVALTEKPIEVVRPEPGIVDPDFDFPESFVTSLVKPNMQELEKPWPDLDSDMRDTNWEVTDTSTSKSVEFKFEIPTSQLEKLGYVGPITILKRFIIPDFPAEELEELNSRSFHLKFELEVKNESDQTQKLAYEIDGPTGLTAETWWYANKIHGRQTAIGYVAGARDIVGSTAAESYIFYGCPEIVKGAQKTIPDIKYVSSPYDEPAHRELNFVGVDSHYFNVSLLPETEPGTTYDVNSVTGYLNSRQSSISEIPKNARLQKLVDCTFQLTASMEIAAGESVTKSFDIFCGPKEPELLAHYGLGDVQTFGWFSWCSKVLLAMLHFFYWVTFKTSYGLAIILLTVLVRCLMIPISRKAALNAQMMQHLQPQMKEIAEKYKDDMEKRSVAQRELYKKYNFNPFGGCFMMVFQLPIFYGLYKGLNVDIALRDQPLIPGMEWCSNLAAPDQLLYWKSWMPVWLGDETGWLGPYLNILPLITMVLFIAQQKLFTPPPTDDQQKFMQKMMTFMMLAMGIMFFKVPSGLCLYFITSSLWGIIERKALPKPVLNTEKLSVDQPTVSRASKKLAKNELLKEEKKSADMEARKLRNAERKRKLKQRGT